MLLLLYGDQTLKIKNLAWSAMQLRWYKYFKIVVLENPASGRGNSGRGLLIMSVRKIRHKTFETVTHEKNSRLKTNFVQNVKRR